MDNNGSNASDYQLLCFVSAFLGWIGIVALQKWFGSWIQHETSRALLLIVIGVVLAIVTTLARRKLWNHRIAAQYEKSVLAHAPNSVYCGKTDKNIEVYIKTRQRIMHTQVVGTTNAGKTESVILPWAIQDIKQGRGLLLIDGKADRDLLEKLWAYSVKYRRTKDFKLFSLGSINQSFTFNPLLGGTAEEITERIFGAFTFENPFYKSLQYEVLAQTLRVFESASEVPTFLKLHQAITNPKYLQKLCERSGDLVLNEWVMNFKNLSGIDRDQRTSGLTSQISQFAFGQSAQLFNSTSPDIEIGRALAHGQIVYFQLPVLLSPFLGSVSGKLVLQCLQSAIANRHRGITDKKNFFSVFLDDFSEYLYPGFVSVLNKSRSANVGVVFAHQALGDIKTLGDAVANAILTNSNLKIFMRGNDPDSAEHFAKIIGTQSSIKMTERRKVSLLRSQSTGDVSAREVEEFVVHPNYFKRDLGVGEAVMIVPHDRGSRSIRIKFERFPDLKNVPMSEVESHRPEGFCEESLKASHHDETVTEVLRKNKKEPVCLNSQKDIVTTS